MANDGKIFDSPYACTEYEHNLNKSYWEIDCNYTGDSAPEGITYTFKIALAIPDLAHDAKLFIQDWCYKLFGSPLLCIDINGDPIPRYSIRKVNKAVYEKGKTIPFDKNESLKTWKLFGDANVDINYGLQFNITGFYGLIEPKYKDIKDIDIHEKNRIDSLLGQNKHTKCDEKKTSDSCMNKTTSAGHHFDEKHHCDEKYHYDEKHHCQKKPDHNNELDKEIESILDSISSVLNAKPNYESLPLVINGMLHNQHQAGVYNKSDIIRELRKYCDTNSIIRPDSFIKMCRKTTSLQG
jgi:hypothetical protein